MNFRAGYEQRTPVHMAATVHGCEHLLDWMLRNGGDPDKTNRKGYTPLGEAIETGCPVGPASNRPISVYRLGETAHTELRAKRQRSAQKSGRQA
jgi:hypothetical protein